MTCKQRPISGNEPFDAIAKDYNRYCGRIVGNEIPGGDAVINIFIDSDIVRTFSEEVQPLTVTNVGDGTGSFEVYNDTDAEWVAGVLSTTDNIQWTFNPTSNFTVDDRLTLYLKDTILTVVGSNPYEGPFEVEYLVITAPVVSTLAHYPLTFDANDVSGNDNHASAVNSPTFDADGVTTNGIDNYVLIPLVVFETAKTIIFDIAESLTGTQIVFGTYLQGTITDSGTYCPFIVIGEVTSFLTNETFGLSTITLPATIPHASGAEGTSSTEYQDGVRRRLAITHDTDTGVMSFFTNGVQDTTLQYGVNNPVVPFLNSDRAEFEGMAIGKRRTRYGGVTSEDFWAKTVREVKFYDATLTPAEISAEFGS